MPGNQLGNRLKAARATVRPKLRDVAWAAGFYEGEGTCFYQPKTRSIRAVVNQVEREPLEKMLRWFGGHIYAIPAHHSSKPSWRWVAYGARARGVLLTIYGMLSPKRQGQIRAALAGG